MKTFVKLMGSNAQVAAYHKTMGLTKQQILGHIQNVTFYRQVIKLTEQIRPLLRNKKGNEDKLEELRNELKDTYRRWRDD